MSYNDIRFFVYARKSTDREDKQIQSIEDQIDELKPLIRRDRLRVIDWLSEAKTAKVPHVRPIFADMVRRIKSEEADGIICWKLNRLSRNPYESGLLQQLLQDGTIKCIRTPERTYLPGDNAILFAFEASMANQYSRDLKTDVERGVRKKAERQWWPFAPPPGYLVNSETKEVEPDPTPFALLRRAWDLMLTETYTVPQIVDQLKGWGYLCKRTKTKPARPLSRTSLYRIFNNPFYAGTFTFQGKLVQGRHTPMVSPEEFRSVQRRLGRNLPEKPEKRLYPFSGFMRCGVCGCRITGEYKVKHYKTTKRSQTYIYYHCTGYKGCSKTSSSEEAMRNRILSLILDCRVYEPMVAWSLETLHEVTPAARPTNTIIAESQKELETRLEKRLEGLHVMREEGDISSGVFRQRKETYEAQLTKLAGSRTGREEAHRAWEYEVRTKVEQAPHLYARFLSDDIHQQRQAIAALSSNYFLTLGNLEIEPHPVFDKIRTFEPSRSGPEQIKGETSGPDSSAWRAFRDAIRNLIDNPPDPPTERHLGVERGPL